MGREAGRDNEAVPASGPAEIRNWEVWACRHHGRSDDPFGFADATLHQASGVDGPDCCM